MDIITPKYLLHETEHNNYFDIILGGKLFFSSDLRLNYLMFGFGTEGSLVARLQKKCKDFFVLVIILK